MPDAEKSYYPAYYEQEEDAHDIVGVYTELGRYSGLSIRRLQAALGKTAQRLGNVMVLREHDPARAMFLRPDRTVGVGRLDYSNPLMAQISGVALAQSVRGLGLVPDLMQPLERRAYDDGFDSSELFVAADDPEAYPEARLAGYWEEQDYEKAFPSIWMRKPLIGPNGSCIHPRTELYVPHPRVHEALDQLHSMAKKSDEVYRDPYLTLSDNTIEAFNSWHRNQYQDDRFWSRLRLKRDNQVYSSPWQREHPRYSARYEEQEPNWHRFRRWVKVPALTNNYDILFLQRHTGPDNITNLAEPDLQTVEKGYFISSHKSFSGRSKDTPVVYFNGKWVRPCAEPERHRVHTELVNSAYSYAHDPEMTIDTWSGTTSRHVRFY